MRLILNIMQYALLMAMVGSFTAAAAQELPYYGGVGLGTARTGISSKALGITGATATSLSRDENDFGGKIFAGYRLHPYWAVEGGYVDLGKASAKRSMSAPVGSISMDSSNTGWFIDFVGRMPIGNGFSLIGKVGQISSETRTHLSAGGAVSLAPGTASHYKERETNWKYGAGAEYEISKTMAVRSEVELYRKLGKDDAGGEYEVGLFSLNLLLKFE